MTKLCSSLNSTARVRWKAPKVTSNGDTRYETREWHEGHKFVIEGRHGAWVLYVANERERRRVTSFVNVQYAKGNVGAWVVIERALKAGRLPK